MGTKIRNNCKNLCIYTVEKYEENKPRTEMMKELEVMINQIFQQIKLLGLKNILNCYLNIIVQSFWFETCVLVFAG